MSANNVKFAFNWRGTDYSVRHRVDAAGKNVFQLTPTVLVPECGRAELFLSLSHLGVPTRIAKMFVDALEKEIAGE